MKTLPCSVLSSGLEHMHIQLCSDSQKWSY
jgi:hypothetical protein